MNMIPNISHGKFLKETLIALKIRYCFPQQYVLCTIQNLFKM